MPNERENLDALVTQFNRLMGAGLGRSRRFKGREDEEGAGEFGEMLDTLTESIGELREAVGETTEEVEEAQEVAREPGPREYGEAEPAMPGFPGLPDLPGESLGRAVGDIGDRRMVVMQPNEGTQMDILGVLKDMALTGLPTRGVVTKAIGSKL